MRSVILANGILAQWPDAQIEFVLNRHASYIADCPFPSHQTPDNPTLCTVEVNQVISQFKPDLVIFDASGRKAQLKHAHNCGAKVVFISQHRRKRARGMKIGRARVTDCHWVVQPEYVMGDISGFERWKLKLFDCRPPVFTGAIFPHPTQSMQQALLHRYQLQPQEYLLYSAGSGGHRRGNALAADRFAQAAQRYYQASGVKSVMVFGPNYPNPLPELEGIIAINQLSSFEFINLLACARAAVLSGGDTLLQAIALKIPTLAVAVSKDQPNRIKHCAQRGLVLSCEQDASAIVEQLDLLLQQEVLARLKDKMNGEPQSNGMDICLAEISSLLGESFAN
ncbi:hypothetical protein LZP69_14830 [Shewanella sp. AS1]|nr:hypothetical protein [Shewanella sp. AS1]